MLRFDFRKMIGKSLKPRQFCLNRTLNIFLLKL